MLPSPPTSLSTGQLAALACLLEATAPKPGNVHPDACFADMTYLDFVASAIAIVPAMDAAPGVGVGQAVLEAVQATRQLVGKNTNLGTVLLLAPLAKVPRRQPLRQGVAEVLAGMDTNDARLVYEAIRLAQPGGLGSASSADVRGEAPADLVAAMRLAADRDLLARQYANSFAEVLDFIAPHLERAYTEHVAEFARIRARGGSPKSGDFGYGDPPQSDDSGYRSWGRRLLNAIVHVQLETMREFPDSLIARKCGPAVAQESSARAAAVLAAAVSGETAYRAALADFDGWLRADGHRRNPGTTADLLAAGLFAALREGMIDYSASASPSSSSSGNNSDTGKARSGKAKG